MMNSDRGGMADYGFYQAMALKASGVEVIFLCSPDYLHRAKLSGMEVFPLLSSSARGKIQLIHKLLGDISVLCRLAMKKKPDVILFSSYYEYLSPLWAWKLRRLKKRIPIKIASVIHDPIRDFQVGPKWWHEWSIREAYSFLDHAFLHEDEKIPFPKEKTSIIPQGIYSYPQPRKSREETLQDLNIPPDSYVLLSYGFIRDGKNLDILIQSLKHHKDCYLIIAGKEQSESQKSLEYYRDIADKEGVATRCRWITRFITEEESADLFHAVNLVCLTYSSAFRSASAVLNLAVHYQRPVIASSGKGNLKSVVQNYQLGIWVEPDSLDEIINGIQKFRNSPEIPEYERYCRENSWERNAEIVMRSIQLKVER